MLTWFSGVICFSPPLTRTGKVHWALVVGVELSQWWLSCGEREISRTLDFPDDLCWTHRTPVRVFKIEKMGKTRPINIHPRKHTDWCFFGGHLWHSRCFEQHTKNMFKSLKHRCLKDSIGTNIEKIYGFIHPFRRFAKICSFNSLNFFHVSLHTFLVVYIVIANTVFRYTILKIPQNIYILKIYLKQNNPKSIFIHFSMLKKTCSFNHQHLIGQTGQALGSPTAWSRDLSCNVFKWHAGTASCSQGVGWAPSPSAFVSEVSTSVHFLERTVKIHILIPFFVNIGVP